MNARRTEVLDRAQLLALETSRSAALRELVEDLQQTVPASVAGTLLLAALRTTLPLHLAAAVAGLGRHPSSVRSAWQRAGLPPWLSLRAAARLHVLRRTWGESRLAFTTVAMVVGWLVGNSARRFVVRTTGIWPLHWRAATSPIDTRRAWQAALAAADAAAWARFAWPTLSADALPTPAVRVLKQTERTLEAQLAAVREQLTGLGAA